MISEYVNLKQNSGVPQVECMEDRMKLTFRTARPFTGRVFVKGMVDKDQCVDSFLGNTRTEVQYEMNNGQCNMRRSRKVCIRHFRISLFLCNAAPFLMSISAFMQMKQPVMLKSSSG